MHRLHTTRHRLGLDTTVSFDHRAYPLELLNGSSSPGLSLHLTTGIGAVQAAKEQGLPASEALDLGLRRAFWTQSRNISLRPVILAVATETKVVDADALADALDDGRARRQLMDQYHIARTGAVTCSPHLFLPDGTNHPNPGIGVYYTGEYGVGYPIATADEPAVYDGLLGRAAA